MLIRLHSDIAMVMVTILTVTAVNSTSNSISTTPAAPSNVKTAPFLPRCLFSCPAMFGPTPFCAGPVSGCGELKVYNYTCGLLVYNCQNDKNRE